MLPCSNAQLCLGHSSVVTVSHAGNCGVQLTLAGAFWLLACCLAAGCIPSLSLDLLSQTGSGLELLHSYQ